MLTAVSVGVLTLGLAGRQEYREQPGNMQLGLYALAAARKYDVPQVYAELYYLRSGRRKGHLFTPEDLRLVERRVHWSVMGIIDDRHFHPTDDSRACRICDFGKTGLCPVGKARLGRW